MQFVTAETARGFTLEITGAWQAPPCEFRYPEAIWSAYPAKQSLISQLAYLNTLVTPLILRHPHVRYDTARPRFLDTYREYFKQAIPNLVEHVAHESSADILDRFESLDIAFSGEPDTETLTEVADWNPRRVVLPLSFGKDSLTSLAMLRKLGYEVIPVFIDQRTLPRVLEISLGFMQDLEERFGLECARVDNELHLLSDYEVLKQPRSYLYQAQVHFIYMLAMLPFCYFHKAPVIIQSNELANSLQKRHREGGLAAHKVMQSEPINRQVSELLQTFTDGQVSAANPIGGLGDLSLNLLLYKRFHDYSDMRVSCHMEITEHKHWCHDCVRCAHAYLDLLAMGKDPTQYGFDHSMLTEDGRHRFRLYEKGPIDEDDHYRQFFAQEELLSFHLAYLRGCRDQLVIDTVQQFPLNHDELAQIADTLIRSFAEPANTVEQEAMAWFNEQLDVIRPELINTERH